MRFGMILLVLVMLCSLAGSLIPQGEQDMTYVRSYGAYAAVTLKTLGLTDIFHAWYFILLEILLCGNLILCSILRFPVARRAFAGLKEQTRTAEPDQPLAAGQAEHVREVLRRNRFRQDGSLWHKNGAGVYGSFLVHLSILVILLFGSLVLMTPQVQDRTVMPGESLTLEDGTVITCLSFHIEDETGRLDYASRLRAAAPDGREVKEQEIRSMSLCASGATRSISRPTGRLDGCRSATVTTGPRRSCTSWSPASSPSTAGTACTTGRFTRASFRRRTDPTP